VWMRCKPSMSSKPCPSHAAAHVWSRLAAGLVHRARRHGCRPARRRAVPLAVALLNVSNPAMSAMDALSRLSHDADAEVAQNAVLSLGAR